MNKNNKLNFLKLLLRASAVLMFLVSFTHLFCAEWYHEVVIGLTGVDFTHGFTAAVTNVVGVLYLGISAAVWLAASNPIRNKVIIKMLYIINIGLIIVFSYHVVFQGYTSKMLGFVVIITIQLILLTILYPWKESKIKKY